jgi:putative ABC transport system substrate-binding protein
MRRRAFIKAFAGFPLIGWTAALAQQSSPPVVGFLVPRAPGESPHLAAAFHRGLNEVGLMEGRNLAIEYRFAENRLDRIPALLKGLVDRQVSVIAAFGTQSARAAKAATSKIPVIFVTGDDPIDAGIVSRLDRPDGNLTGVSFISSTLGAKRLELLRTLIPKIDLVAMLVDQNSPESRTALRDTENAAKAIGLSIVALGASSENEINASFEAMLERKIRGFVVGGSPFINGRTPQLVSWANRHSVVSMFSNRDAVISGGLISYGTSITDAYRQAAVYVGRVIRGERIADLPVLQPTKFELVVNLKTAKALGVEIPPMLLALADEAIE